MKEILIYSSVIFTGFAGGIAVGGGFVAFITVLGIIPRLSQITKGMFKTVFYEYGSILGCLFGSIVSIYSFSITGNAVLVIVVGLISGTFIGMFAAALTEIVNVFPIIAKRLGILDKIWILLMAIIFGKICGSLYYWFYFVELLKE